MSEPRPTIAGYTIVRFIGGGGMGEVWLAQDVELERLVAIKVLSPEMARDPVQRRRFRQEARAASAVEHPHICVIHEVGETQDGRPFLAMEYVEGQTLAELTDQRRLTLDEIVRLASEVADALTAAHARGIVHRDIKPANLMFDPRGHVKVLDFGVAKRLPSNSWSTPATGVEHTGTGLLIGTPSYMSPEQVLGRELDARTDLFSLGVVLYELIAGQRPFLGQTVGETIDSILHQQPPSLNLEPSPAARRLERVIQRCLEKDPNRRFASAQDLAQELHHLAEDPGPQPPIESTTRPKAATSIRTRPRSLALIGMESLLRRPRRLAASQRLTLGLCTLLTLLLGAWAWWAWRGTPGRATRLESPSAGSVRTESPSVAVLPFVNLGESKADEYLSDGISEEIITALSKIQGLRVPARTSCFAFKGRKEDIRRIGQRLRVATVLEGSISKVGNRLRVSAQLINIADGFHLWSETYDRTLDDLLAIRTDVASRVAEALKGQLLGEDRQQLAGRSTDDATAYRNYLQGRYLWNRRTGENLRKAIEQFNEAISRDPAYALAYAGLADSYVVSSQYTGLPARETYPKARAAAFEALKLDPRLGEPHATLGFVAAFFDWDWPGAELEFRKAIELAPNYATAHHWFARMLDALRRHEEALTHGRRAQEIDPLSPVINANLGLELYLNARYDDALEVLRAQIAIDPSFPVAYDGLGLVYLQQGRVTEAVEAFETMSRLQGPGHYGLGEMGLAYARAGRTNDALGILDRLNQAQRDGSDCRVAIALVQHALGRNEGALESLERALQDHASGLEWIHFAPLWRDLVGHPRAQAILQRMKLAP